MDIKLNLQKSPEVDIIIEFVKEFRPKNVLEVGSNYGRELKFLEELASVYGIDKDAEKIETAKGYVDGTFKVAEASAIPYKDNKFDFVYSSGVFAHGPPEAIKDYIKELFRVSNKYILLVEYIGSRLSKNTIGNCKKNTWIHDYNLLASVLDVNIKYNQQKFFGTDLFQVLLLEKILKKKTIVNTFFELKEKRFVFKIGKLKLEIE